MVLPKTHRLRRREDFNAVYQGGRRFRSSHFTLLVLVDSPGRDVESSKPLPSRFGISISQKVSKRAVVRNRIKRQIRAILREFLPHLQVGRRLVISVRPNAVGCEYQEFLRELRKLLTQAEVLDGHS
ncbi:MULTISPECIES: ribonuclease P protein component [unclassified Leptolyngbya]|uniref:ribonuclease P protein component n=1 Tax=unclassified Leptolyngbya TaxID=2650499 RepID=UPI0016869793|nr:ribonuclease P protein component [Leptolyngbya sp. FACHB-8]MBD2154332.1 ribonuclease P protein component [Leptolyngbya sp. FACHB-16]